MTLSRQTTLKALLVAAAVAATLTGCNRDKEKAATPAAAPPTVAATPAVAGAPFEFKSETPFAKVELTLPQEIKSQPELHAQLYAAGVKDLREFMEGAQADRTEAGGDEGTPAYDSEIGFDTPVETGKLFSIARSDYEFTGGAHGNTSASGVLWDKALKRAIAPTSLLRPGVNMAALDGLLCAALNVEKKKRDPEAETLRLAGKADDMWNCPHAADTPVVLVPGTQPGKAGGLLFLIGAYEAGPYAEGPYEVPVPQTAIRSLLAPAYADEFAGTPVLSEEPAN
ncbi:MAG TPA: DUF4163 domain-containing protein [Brevundimonas sp.]|jgi:hypothetical protein